MRLLAIETSCDETALAVLEAGDDRFSLKKNLIASQIKIHRRFGGVVPEIAAREHAKTLPLLLKAARLSPSGQGLDAICVTVGPGLISSLRVGLETARALAVFWKKPLLDINHLEGHIYSNWLTAKKPIHFPALNLIVSGGHTELVLMHNHGQYKLLGQTRDDAAGEAFDKAAKLLCLGYPGGPAISEVASSYEGIYFDLPRPMIKSPDLDFSFSGLKTALLYAWQGASESERQSSAFVKMLAASFEEAVVESSAPSKMRWCAIKKFQPRTILLSGGVAANERLRERFRSELRQYDLRLPAKKFTGDNAAMIAVAGFYRAKQKKFADPLKIQANPNLTL